MEFLQMLLHLDQNFGHAAAQFGPMIYIALFAIVFCEMAFVPLFFLPGDPLLFICGSFCAIGTINIFILLPLLIIAAVSGSVLNYWTGAAVGEKVFTQNYRWLDKEALLKTHAFYENYGGVTFLLSPFVAVVRTFAPFIGGVSAMMFPKFLLYVVCGAVLWVGTLVASGYFFGNVPFFHDHFSVIVLLGIVIGAGSLAIAALRK